MHSAYTYMHTHGAHMHTYKYKTHTHKYFHRKMQRFFFWLLILFLTNVWSKFPSQIVEESYVTAAYGSVTDFPSTLCKYSVFINTETEPAHTEGWLCDCFLSRGAVRLQILISILHIVFPIPTSSTRLQS